MTELGETPEPLKTLKEIHMEECPEGDSSYIGNDGACERHFKQQTKQEAIKWWKAIRKLRYNEIIKLDDCSIVQDHFKEEISDWIKHFFNIKDEEIK